MKHLLFFEGAVDNTSLENLLDSLSSSNSPRLVYVNSPGGKIDHLMPLVPAIEAKKIITAGDAVGSAAVILFLLGYPRYAFPESSFYFHKVSGGDGMIETWTDIEVQRILKSKELSEEVLLFFKEWFRDIRNAQSWVIDFMSEKTGTSKEVFTKLMDNEITLSIREAIQFGLVHKVLQKDAIKF